MSLPGSLGSVGGWPSGGPVETPQASEAAREAAGRVLRRAVERVGERFDLPELAAEIDDLVVSGAAAPLLDVLVDLPVVQLAVVAAGVVAAKLPRADARAEGGPASAAVVDGEVSSGHE